MYQRKISIMLLMILLFSCTFSISLAQDELWICAFCNIENGAKYCRGCGRDKNKAMDQRMAACARGEHEWEAADCAHPRQCLYCKTTEGDKLPHQWQSKDILVQATCRDEGAVEMVCTACGEKTEKPIPVIDEHQWQEATYDAAKVCIICGKTEGEPLSRIRIGQYIAFGHYPQFREDDHTPIEWIVVEVKEQRALLVSRYALDSQRYHDQGGEVTWADSDLRIWLNRTFLNNAFTKAEQDAILETEIDNGWNTGYSGWSADGGQNTIDKVFLLSYSEAQRYFDVEHRDEAHADKNMKARISPTAYAISKGAYASINNTTTEGSNACWWWLRSPGSNQQGVANIGTDGALYAARSNDDYGCVRPALWINLKSNAFSILFGHYPQTESGTDSAPIEWNVLELRDQKALLLSKYGLDSQPYHTNASPVTWETSSLRKWLNDEFVFSAFDKKERSCIVSTEVDNGNNQGNTQWKIDGGNNTQDKVFLLSYGEAARYLGVKPKSDSDEDYNVLARVAPTNYAVAKGAFGSMSMKTMEDFKAGWWWLRSPGSTISAAANVGSTGMVYAAKAEELFGCVRPAVWVDISSDMFGIASGAGKTEWEKTEDNQWVYYENGVKTIGWKEIDSHWYFFDLNGNMVTGWMKKGDELYYFKPDGSLVKDGTYTIQDIEYSFNAKGIMISDNISEVPCTHQWETDTEEHFNICALCGLTEQMPIENTEIVSMNKVICWENLQYTAIAVAMSDYENDRRIAKSGPSQEYRIDIGSYQPSHISSINALFIENDFVYVDMNYPSVGHRRLYFALKCFKSLESVGDAPTFSLVPGKLNCDVIPRFGPGEEYDQYMYTDQQGRKLLILNAETGVTILMQEKNWYFVETKSSQGLVRVWVPIESVEM